MELKNGEACRAEENEMEWVELKGEVNMTAANER